MSRPYRRPVQESTNRVASPVTSYAEYMECPGCGYQVPLSVEGLTWHVASPRDIVERLLAKLGRLEREELWVLTLNQKLAVLDANPLYRGSVTTAQVRVAELFSEAIRRHGTAIALVHTHPSGDPTPSPDDLHLTSETIAAGRLLDINVIDHIVLGNGMWVSLRDRGIVFSG